MSNSKLNISSLEELKNFFGSFVDEQNRVPRISDCRNLLISGENRVMKLCGTSSYPAAVVKLGFNPPQSPFTKDKISSILQLLVQYFAESKGDEQCPTAQKFPDWMKKKVGYSYTIWKNPMGWSWNDWLSKAGLPLSKEVYDPQDLKKRFEEFVAEYVKVHGRAPLSTEVRGVLHIDMDTLKRAYGIPSFSKILVALGYEPHSVNFSKDALINALIKQKVDNGGRNPVAEDFKYGGYFKDGTKKPQISCFYKKFKSFSDALLMANLPVVERAHGYSYFSNHGDINPSRIQGEVDDLFQYIPHHHNYFYKNLGLTEKGIDADLFLVLQTIELQKQVIIEVNGYTTRKEYEENLALPKGSRQETYAKDLRRKEELIKKGQQTNKQLDYYFVHKDDNSSEVLKDLLEHFPAATHTGNLLSGTRVASRVRNPFLHREEKMIEAIQKTFQKTGKVPTMHSVFKKEGVSRQVFNHPRFQGRTWEDWLLMAGISTELSFEKPIL